MIDLSGIPVVDDHCHGFRLADRLRLDASGFEARLTYMGMLYDAGAGEASEAVASCERELVGQLAGSSLFALAARKALAEFLGCDGTAEAVGAARYAAARTSGREYVRRLLADESIERLIADEGFPDVTRGEFEDEVGVPVHRVWRIESWFLEHGDEHAAFDELEEAFVAALRQTADDARTVAFKSVVAFPAGLAVAEVSRDEARHALVQWRASGCGLDDAGLGQVLHRLLRTTLDVAAEVDKPVHIHCGAGDPFMPRIDNVRPEDLYPLLAAYRTQPIVLIHSGYPWLHSAAYVAATLPFVYLDVSAWQPWATLATESGLELLLGSVPTAKILYGSDEASEPELLWLSARLFRRALSRVLDSAVARDFVSGQQALHIAQGVLGGDTKALHGIPAT